MNGSDSATQLRPAQDDVVEIDASDLPAFCPNPKMPLWSSHPRVYLELGATGKAMCSYCGTRYRLAPGSVPGGH
ncbi:MAG: zinc-finger domain-containing protein [Burkholderiales bacterium]|jgi:uncharacterized Zn-finger protein|nr:MAG: zinc-finger domain-containing protein [Burkholderiales bacterium]